MPHKTYRTHEPVTKETASDIQRSFRDACDKHNGIPSPFCGLEPFGPYEGEYYRRVDMLGKASHVAQARNAARRMNNATGVVTILRKGARNVS